MCDVTFLDNQRQDNSVWSLGYRQENQRTVVQFSGGGATSLSLLQSIQSGFCKQLILLASEDQGLFLLWVKQLVNIVLTLRMSGKIPPLPYVFMVCKVTILISTKSMGCTCRMQEKRHKLFQAQRMKRTKAHVRIIYSLKWGSTLPGDTDLLY